MASGTITTTSDQRPPTTTTGPFVAGYFRISEDAEDTREGVENQAAWFTVWAEETHPGVPVRTYVDNDVTGKTAERGGLDDLRADLAAGGAVALWVRDQSRLQRDEELWFAIKRELIAAGIAYLDTRRKGRVPVDDLVTSITACVDADRIRQDRKNLMDRQQRDAEKGYPPSTPVFGYRHVRGDDGKRTLAPVPEQAEIIREALARILRGESLTAIARDFGRRGVTGARGKVIGTSAAVESIVTSPTVAGFRVYRGQLVKDALGQRVRGNWADQAILSVSEWEDVCAVVAQRKTANKAAGARGGAERRRYLLTGLVTCDKPGCQPTDAEPTRNRMYGTSKRQSGGRPHALVYKCRSCGTTVDMATADDVALDVVAERLGASVELAEALTVDDFAGRRDEIHRALEGVEAQRSEAKQDRVDELLDRDDYRDLMRRLNDRRDNLRAELAELVVPGSERDPRAALHALGEARRAAGLGETEAIDTLRALAAEWLSAVLVAPAVRGQDPRGRLTVR